MYVIKRYLITLCSHGRGMSPCDSRCFYFLHAQCALNTSIVLCLHDCQGELINAILSGINCLSAIMQCVADRYTRAMSILLIAVCSHYLFLAGTCGRTCCVCVCVLALEMRSRVVSETQLRCLLVSVVRPRCREQVIRLRGRLSC